MAIGYFGALEDDDIKNGKSYLRYFYDYAKANHPSTFTWISFDEFLNAYGEVKSKIWHKNVGVIARVGEMSVDDIQEVMEAMAEAGEGKLPRLPTEFGEALSKKATDFSLFDTIGWVTKETLKDVATGVQEAGSAITSTVSNTLSIAKYAVPAILVGGLALWVYLNVRRFSGK